MLSGPAAGSCAPIDEMITYRRTAAARAASASLTAPPRATVRFRAAPPPRPAPAARPGPRREHPRVGPLDVRLEARVVLQVAEHRYGARGLEIGGLLALA